MKVKGGGELGGCSGGHGALEAHWGHAKGSLLRVVRMAGVSIRPGNADKEIFPEVSLPAEKWKWLPGRAACPLRLVGEGKTAIPDLPEGDCRQASSLCPGNPRRHARYSRY